MQSFTEIFAIAAARKGGAAAVEAKLAIPLPVEALAAKPASLWLETMAKAIFQAGFSWTVIENKWPGFQAAFENFNVPRVAFYHDEDIDRLLADKGIIRNGGKIKAVIHNAQLLNKLEQETGSVAAHFARWPSEDFAGLVALLADQGAHLGGVTAQRVCRMMGCDAYILSQDVCKRLIAEGVVDKAPTSKKAMAAVQAAFNQWRAESGRPLTQISQVLAMSID